MSRHAPENGASAVPKPAAASKTLRGQGQCVASAKKTGRRCEAWTLTGGEFCYHHAAESPDEANGGPVVTAAEKRAAVVAGALRGMRRGLFPVDLAQAIELRIDTLEEIRAVRALLLKEIRAKVWSHGDVQDQLGLLAEARRGAVDLERLKQAREEFVRGRRTTSLVKVSFDPTVTALATQYRSPRRVGPSPETPQ